MSVVLLSILAVVLAYLLGSIPFGYLTARWVRGIDIRTVGSGNIGATNVGRVLGFKFFVLVFVLDLLKGFVPAYALPRAVAALTGRSVPDLGVLAAVSAILGHNFPIYLKLRGGKGVATSLGAFFALDFVASLSSAIAFVIFVMVTRYVSLSSVLAALVFFLVYYVEADDPWGRNQMAMTLVTMAMVVLLIFRHRKNLARIGAGTEPKVAFRKKATEGRVAWVLLVILLLAGVGAVYGVSVQASRRSELAVGSYELTEVARAGTGHQRAERVAFADGGKLLAVTCPRYNRVVLYRVTDGPGLEVVRDIELTGRPMALCATRDRFFVLERPAGDARHVEPGWWEVFDLQGRPSGSRVPAGMYPDDLAVTPDGRTAVVLTSGRAEGDPDRPPPALEVFDLTESVPEVVGRVEFDRPGDDPDRVTLSATGECAAVALLGSNQVAAIDLADRSAPRLIGRSSLAEADVPTLSTAEGDAILMPGGPERNAILIPRPASKGWLACTLPRDSNLEVVDASTRRLLGHLRLRGGALNLTAVRLTGLAYAPERSLLAVANRSGGVHLIAVRARSVP